MGLWTTLKNKAEVIYALVSIVLVILMAWTNTLESEVNLRSLEIIQAQELTIESYLLSNTRHNERTDMVLLGLAQNKSMDDIVLTKEYLSSADSGNEMLNEALRFGEAYKRSALLFILASGKTATLNSVLFALTLLNSILWIWVVKNKARKN